VDNHEAHILVVDDDENELELLRVILEPAGYRVDLTSDGLEGLRAFFSDVPDLVLLDVHMPTMDGWELLDRIRQVSEAPVIMLTGMTDERHKVQGLRNGADDYVTKPFGERELLARVDAVLRRSKTQPEAPDIYQDADLRLDISRREVYVCAQRVELYPTAFNLLVALVQNRGIVLSADRLLELCWPDRYRGRGTVRTGIGILRKKLVAASGGRELVETVKGFGYRYTGREA